MELQLLIAIGGGGIRKLSCNKPGCCSLDFISETPDEYLALKWGCQGIQTELISTHLIFKSMHLGFEMQGSK